MTRILGIEERKNRQAARAERSVALYTSGKSLVVVAGVLKCSAVTVGNDLRKAGIPLRPQGFSVAGARKRWVQEERLSRYLKKYGVAKPIATLAKMFRVSADVIGSIRKAAGYEKWVSNRAYRRAEKIRLMCAEAGSRSAVARKLGLSRQRISQICAYVRK